MDKVYTRVSDQNGAYIPLQEGGGRIQYLYCLYKGVLPAGVGGGGGGQSNASISAKNYPSKTPSWRFSRVCLEVQSTCNVRHLKTPSKQLIPYLRIRERKKQVYIFAHSYAANQCTLNRNSTSEILIILNQHGL